MIVDDDRVGIYILERSLDMTVHLARICFAHGVARVDARCYIGLVNSFSNLEMI